ncbi:hypothetical protein F7Q92_04595 [Ideonella dechloratans]|uniref:Uncharacterized protein n=1 Tax=Ideonella dechloratans TaxID=36863 RepID=A0A643FFC6_IDEDE|nr:hypothetical protein [Ideonella dechloratans]KAB0584230.1 hypothetical protein F7Q92_04595 [Ideonella dechloratans]UFU08577.1 hypothetical protein LRM40_09470 [Ideonella dechloratans]
MAELLADPLLRSLKQSDVARFLDVTERTLRRWKKTGAPRQARLLLWAISLHGLDTLQTEADNTVALFAGMARGLAEEVDAHRRRIAHLIRLGDFGSANSPHLGFESANALRKHEVVNDQKHHADDGAPHKQQMPKRHLARP